MARLTKRERAARRLEAAEEHARQARVVRVHVDGAVSIRSSWSNYWPRGKPRVRWEYNGRTAGRIHRKG